MMIEHKFLKAFVECSSKAIRGGAQFLLRSFLPRRNRITNKEKNDHHQVQNHFLPLMATFDLDSFDELEATPPEDAKEATEKHMVSVKAALEEAEEAMAKSVEFCKRLDPEVSSFNPRGVSPQNEEIIVFACFLSTGGTLSIQVPC
jgi:hypothetical protein